MLQIHALECKYHELYTPLYDKRNLIASGEYEPTEEVKPHCQRAWTTHDCRQECDWPSEDEDEEELAENVKEKAKVVDEGDTAKDEELVKGVPGFWLTIFKNVEMLAEMVQVMIRMYWQLPWTRSIQDTDEPLLELLQDVKITFRCCLHFFQELSISLKNHS